MSFERNPIFQEDTLFLKVLVEVKISLLIYDNGNLTRFFYKKNDSAIIQLVYKRYLNKEKNIAYNNSFRQQLFVELKSEGITLNNIENTNYNKSDLEKLFLKYNVGENSGYVNFEPKQNKDLFRLSIRPGLNYSNLTIQNSMVVNRDVEFGNKFNFRIGIDAELILPFNKNLWSVFIEPTFQNYQSKVTTETNNVAGGILVSRVNYSSIELPLGVRRYFYLNDKSKIFFNFSYTFDFSNSSSVTIERRDGSVFDYLTIESRRNLAFGIGYKYNDKFCIEMLYQTSRELFGEYVYWSSDYKTFSLILGYILYKK
jgi:hypothetical protein